MVQELHVLRCFSCETFQSQIVKKTNKWECKLCGAKQSVKKVYGKGSGKDCRIHTQKLNSLRGQKEEIARPSHPTNEFNKAESPMRCLTKNDPNDELKRIGKWAEFIDGEEIVHNQDKFLKQENSPLTISAHQSKKQKRMLTDNFESEDVKSNTSGQNYHKSHKQSKHIYQNTHLSEHTKKSKLIEYDYMTEMDNHRRKGFKSEHETKITDKKLGGSVFYFSFKNNYKTSNSNRPGGKWDIFMENKDKTMEVSSKKLVDTFVKTNEEPFKVRKLLDIEGESNYDEKTSSDNNCISHHLTRVNDSNTSNFQIRNSFQIYETSSDVCNLSFKPTSSGKSNSSNQSLDEIIHNNFTVNKTSCSNKSIPFNPFRMNEAESTDNSLKCDIFRNNVDKAEIIITQSEKPRTLSLPVFEQSVDLSDSDFELGF